IRFQLPKESVATLQVFDSHGKVVFSQSGLFGPGLHAVLIDLSGVQAGVLYYQLETPEYRAVEKMAKF
ncbi:MAG: T9SS type A sorting domain-containing protein, partial [Saprospiraceae bacterium]|nr:T9SS type A sorting domain-containing protein [Saprospiraceae bacterium]